MSVKPRAKLVLMEPGVEASSAIAASAEQNHVLLLGANESLTRFSDRVRRRADSLRHESRALSDVTYVVGNHQHADWQTRQRLLSELCDDLAPDGSVAVHAPSSARSAVLGCLGDLQASLSRGLELRAVFTDAATVR
jgi:hypothetical protein